MTTNRKGSKANRKFRRKSTQRSNRTNGVINRAKDTHTHKVFEDKVGEIFLREKT